MLFRSVEQSRLQFKERLIVATHVSKNLPIVASQRTVIGRLCFKFLASGFLVDSWQAVVELVLLIQPDAANLMQFGQRDQFQARELRRPQTTCGCS